MTLTSANVRLRRRAAAIIGVAVLVTSCAGVTTEAQVPGANPAPVSGSIPADEVDAELFTRDSTPGSDLDPSPVTSSSSAASSSAVSSSAVASTTVVPAEVASTTTAAIAVDERRTPPPAGVPFVVAPSVSGWAAFDLHVSTILAAGSSAVSATVLRDGEVVHEVALGQRTTAGGDPAQIGDRYRVASISKVITSITLLRLVEQNLIGLDDPVGARLAARVGVTAPVAGVSEITVRQLLTHRSGIAQYENLMFRRQVESCEQAAAAGLSRGLERVPGTTFRYSNLNFCLAGLLIEELTALSYADAVQRELLAPLGLDGMRLAGTFDVRDGDIEHRSDAGRNYMEVLGAAGSWIASPTDVALIINSLDLATPGWKPLSSTMRDTMAEITVDPPAPPTVTEPVLDEFGNVAANQPAPTTTTVPPPPNRGYGMGLMIFGPDSFGHTGTLESTHAMTARGADGITWAITVSGDHPSSSRDLAGVVAEALRYARI